LTLLEEQRRRIGMADMRSLKGDVGYKMTDLKHNEDITK
jgi:hypothetical protein